MKIRRIIGLGIAVSALGLGHAANPDPSRILVRSGSLPVGPFAPKGPQAARPATAEVAWPSFPRPFAAVFPRPDQLRSRGAVAGTAAGSVSVPAGRIPLASLAVQPHPLALAVEAADAIDTATDVWMVCLAAGVDPGAAAAALTALETRMRLAGAVPLSRPGPECLVISGGASGLPVSLSIESRRVYAWAPGLFADPEIAIAPMPTPEQAADPVLHLVASVFRGAAVDEVARRLEALGATLEGRSGGMIALAWPIQDLRAALDSLTGLPLRALAERSVFVSADEEVSTSLQTGEFNGGRRPYLEAGVDGSSQVIAVSDTGLSLDTTVFADGVSGDPGSATAGPPGLAHRKIVGYVRAGDLPGNAIGGGDLLTCDGTSGLTHGHLVASIAAGNASELLDDVRLLPGFETARVGTATPHAVDGIAPGARVLFIDTQAAGACTAGSELETQNPGLLSAGTAAARSFGEANGVELHIHNLSFSRFGPLTPPFSSYTIDDQDLDAFLHDHQDYLVVVAAGNRGTDRGGDGNLDFASITSPGTAKNVLTVGASILPNDTLDPDDAYVRGIPNRGIEMIARFGRDSYSSSQGPAAFTIEGLANNWRMKPDVVAPGDETLVSERLVGPVTCISTDDDQAGPVECARHTAGGLFGTSFSAAGVSGAAALVRDYFRKGYAPAGQAGGGPQDLSGPELKAAMIASTDLLTGNLTWKALSGNDQLTFYNPKHLTRPTPEQGYGRVQLDHLLPLASDPVTPSFILSESTPLALAPAPASVHERLLRVVRADEEFRVVTAWYDLESEQTGSEAPGELVRDLDLTLTDCGPDGECDTADDLTYYGNHFHEDENFDRNLVAIPDLLRCGGVFWGAECTVSSPDCDTDPWGTECIRVEDYPSEDCDGDGLLDRSEFSLAIDPARVGALCDSGARDRNNPVEAIFLSPTQLAEGRLLRLRLEWVRTSEVAPPPEVEAGLVIVGGFTADLATDRIRLDKAEYGCADALALEVLDGAGDALPADVGMDVVVTTRDALGGFLDQETAWVFQPAGDTPSPGGSAMGRFVSAPRAVSSRFAPVSGDGILTVVDEGRIDAAYEGGAPGTGTARATARVRCRPMVTLLPMTRRGTNAKYGLSGGCDPRARLDPRGILFGQRPGEGLNTSGDRYLDPGESLIYSVSLRNDEPGLTLAGAVATLRACAAGTGSAGPGCLPAPEVMVLGGAVPVGSIAPGRTQTVSFNLRVSQPAAFPQQVDLVFEVVTNADAQDAVHRSVFRHVLDVDSFDDPALGPEVDGVHRYSTDFPRGGREIRVLAAEGFDPANPDLAAETVTFQDATASGPGLIGNATLLGFDPSTDRFDRAMVNNWPWTFDLDDEGWRTRRRFDSDPGANAELAARHVWQWNTTGECGFQSNDPSQPDGAWLDPNNVIRGRGGIWHTGHALSQPGTPAGRTGYDLGCEDFDIPGDASDYRREAVLDVVSSPIFHRVHAGPDPLGFAYTLEFTRFAFNAQFSARDANPIFAWELDPDASVPEPVDALDFGWLSSDQGPGGFLAGSPASDTDMPHAVFNPNNPHEVSSARALGMLLVPGGSAQNIAALHGPGSPGPFHRVGDPNKAPARSYGEIKGFTGRGFGSPGRRGAAGLPLRNREELLDGFEGGGFTFEDLFGPNETVHADPGGPVSFANPEQLAARRDDFQVNFSALLRENADPTVLALPSYGLGFDDVVVEWVESHPVADRTPCADPSTWTPAGEGGPSARPDLAGGCAGIAWDRTTIAEPDVALVLTVVDADAQFGPDGVDQEVSDPANDDQANDLDGDGFAELEALVVSDTDPLGEIVRLEQVAFVSAVYQAVVQVSGSEGLSSPQDGILFAQENGDGTSPVAVTAAYTDEDINVSGVNGAGVPCPDNPRTAQALTDFVAADILFVTAQVTDEGPGADGDSLADDGETIRLDIAMFNRALEPPRSTTEAKALFRGRLDILRPRRGPLENVEVKLLSSDPDVACILDGTVRFTALPDNQLAWSGPDDPLRFVVGRPTRTSAAALVQAEFILSIRGEYTDDDGVRRRVAAFATPQRFALNLDLDIGGASPATPLSGDSACVGGSSAGRACVSNADCPGEVVPGQSASCQPMPAYLRAGGTSPIAGDLGYFEGFEGAASGAGAGLIGTNDGTKFGPIPGTGFRQAAAINLVNGFMPRRPGWPPINPPKTGADVPQGSSSVDGSRCQYNDPRGPQKHPRSENGAREWDGSDWHVSAQKAFSGQRSLRGGTDGLGLGKDASFDSYHTNQLSAAFSAPMTVGVMGGAILSMQHIVQVADDRTFGIPDGSTADRAYVQVAEYDPAANPAEFWHKIAPFQNAYDKTAVAPYFTNVIFDPYDDFYDAEAALGQTPGFDPNRLTPLGIPLNRDDVSSEDDYFDPNDPQRQFGPSSACFPEFAFAAVGDYTATDPAQVPPEEIGAARGELGNGIWVNSLFALDEYAGRHIRIRFLFTGIDISVGARWDQLFGNSLGNATRGWVLDDVAVSGLLSGPVTLVPDTRVPGEGACPADPDLATPANEAACGSVTADAGTDLVAALSATDFLLDGSASRADACVDGALVYRWRVGGAILSDFRADPELAVRPADTTVYTLDVRCSTDPACVASDSVAVQVEDAGEVSGLPETLGMVRLSPEAPESQQVITEWEAKPGAKDIFVLGVDVQHYGRALRDPPPGPAAALARNLCRVGTALPRQPGRVEGTEGSVDLAAGEIFGYLAMARFASPAGPVHGSLGQGESPGRPAAFPRGRIDPSILADCVDSP